MTPACWLGSFRLGVVISEEWRRKVGAAWRRGCRSKGWVCCRSVTGTNLGKATSPPRPRFPVTAVTAIHCEQTIILRVWTVTEAPFPHPQTGHGISGSTLVFRGGNRGWDPGWRFCGILFVLSLSFIIALLCNQALGGVVRTVTTNRFPG